MTKMYIKRHGGEVQLDRRGDFFVTATLENDVNLIFEGKRRRNAGTLELERDKMIMIP